jgi:phosphopantothenoylcysteine synthetase/decarboxylase
VSTRRVAHLIGFSAPPVLRLDEFIRLLASEDWDTYVILSPTAATWVDKKLLAQISGHPVRVEPRMPHEQDPLPPAEAVIAAPITFNSLNKFAMGISDTLALGLLNESLGLDSSVTLAPCVKAALRRHPVYQQSVRRLSSAGATILNSFDTVEQAVSSSTRTDWSQVLPT